MEILSAESNLFHANKTLNILPKQDADWQEDWGLLAQLFTSYYPLAYEQNKNFWKVCRRVKNEKEILIRGISDYITDWIQMIDFGKAINKKDPATACRRKLKKKNEFQNCYNILS